MKEDDYRVIKDHENNCYYIVKANNIKEEYPLPQTCDCYEQSDCDNYEPGNGSFDSELVNDLRDKFAKKYPKLTDWNGNHFIECVTEKVYDFSQDREHGNIPYDVFNAERDYIGTADDVFPEDVKAEIRSFCADYSSYPTCTALNYWNGHNHQSIIFDSETGFKNEQYELLEESDEEAKVIINECKKAIENGVSASTYGEHMATNKYSFSNSYFESDSWYIWEVTTK